MQVACLPRAIMRSAPLCSPVDRGFIREGRLSLVYVWGRESLADVPKLVLQLRQKLSEPEPEWMQFLSVFESDRSVENPI